jgi:hypothetical protein
LVMGTFGRSLYVLDNIRPLRKIASTQSTVLDTKLAAFEPANGYMASFRDAAGAGFAADANYEGENRRRGAKLMYWYNPPKPAPKTEAKAEAKIEEKKKDKNTKVVETKPVAAEIKKDSTKKAEVKYDTVFVRIYNDQNKLIRTLQHKPDSIGVQAVYWDMTEKGVRMPGTPKPKKNAPDSRGYSVLPGKYKVVFASGDAKDSTSVTINDDPRVPTPREAQLAQRTLMDRMGKSIVQLTEITDRLTEAEETTKQVQSQLKDREGKTFEDLGKACKSMLDSIKTKRELITGKKFEKQGYGRPYQVTPQGKIGEISYYVGTKTTAPTNDDVKQVEILEELTKSIVEKVNKFFAEDWTNYRKKVEGTPMSPFKDYQPIGKE